MNDLFKIEYIYQHSLPYRVNEEFYQVIIAEDVVKITVDFIEYELKGKNIIFLSPFQLLTLNFSANEAVLKLKFHGDFYCIEYHKNEVACNGILFNDIYTKPFIPLDESLFDEITSIIRKLNYYSASLNRSDQDISRTYLQLILALCSKEKINLIDTGFQTKSHSNISGFKKLLESHVSQNKTVSFYADHYGMSTHNFSKKVKLVFDKPPSKLIKERLVLESKRRLHLTFSSIKQIANELGFKDEFYFSRFFKKEVGVSPKFFREKTGYSIAAK